MFGSAVSPLIPDDDGLSGHRGGAACAALPPHVVFARRLQDAAPALRACPTCPILAECERIVAPAETWFDGVSAGRLWRNGRPVATTADLDGSLDD